AGVVLEQEDPSLRVAVVGAVTDVMQDVKRLVLKRLQQPAERRPLEPLELDRAGPAQSGKRAAEVVALALDVESLVVGRTADHPQHPQRWLHEKRTMRPR